ncbi:LysR family transcriptional regulator [Agaricicola taiwanensis]|uniref:LysR family transcriptional regulator n=1 Tax=Agaricicola taiwanensis TaxID=591372 RepID=A0A8J2YLK5_9RHOB|nr:LysR family transcriptional regulator [Agaricicola taiwanensis]GGE51511.1 LysR family transcriptional regulator [Agaricicola taiwanensis]
MELRHIRYFLAVAEEGNFTRAAARVGIGQPPLSQQIRDLEEEVGTPLFHRVPHGAELTEAGSAFLAAVRGMPDQVALATRAARRAARGETGTLRVGFTGASIFNPLVPATIRAYRRAFAEVDLILTEANSIGLVAALREENIDAAFVRPNGAEGDDIVVHRFADEPMVLALPKGHGAVQGDGGGAMDLSSLAAEPFILTPHYISPTLLDAAVEACRRAGFEPILGQPAPQIATVLSLVAAELGVSIVPASMRQLNVAGVAYRDIAGEPPVARLALVHLKTNRTALVQNFAARAIARNRARKG